MIPHTAPQFPYLDVLLIKTTYNFDFLFSTTTMSLRKRKELDPYMRTRICELRNTAQWSYGRIHKAYPDIPLSTIKSTCQSQKTRVNNQSRPRSGRPRKESSIEGPQDQMYVFCSPTMLDRDLMSFNKVEATPTETNTGPPRTTKPTTKSGRE